MNSSYAKPAPNLPIRAGAPPLARPTKEEMEAFPSQARQLLTHSWAVQRSHLEAEHYNLSWLEGRHLLLVGATGPGLGGGLASAVLGTRQAASVTVIGRDLSRSLGYETGKAMQTKAEDSGWGNRFCWLNEGAALEGKPLEAILTALKAVKAERLIYVNTVAAASSGLLPGMPPVFVKDFDEHGLFQWQLTPLSEKQIDMTKSVMGEMATQFPRVLAENGFTVESTVFADWRGSLDKISRDPSQREYGRQGAYSTSLYLPKESIQQATRAAYGSGQTVLDFFLPMMRTRALNFIPGGVMMSRVVETLMAKEDIRYLTVPELALGVLDRLGKSLAGQNDNPFPRLDGHEAPLDEWLFEVLERLNNNENSDFYYKRWLK